MAQKHRNSSKRKTQRKGLSGNPQRRAEQLATEPPEPTDIQRELDQLSGRDTKSLRDIAYRLAGGTKQAPWWRESHELILEKARTLDWSPRLLDIEAETCELVGGQLYDNLQAHDGGHHQTRWLQALVEHVGAALRKAVTDGGEWQPLWTLLYGIALTTPKPVAEDEEAAELRAEFPDIKDPYQTAVTELEEATSLLSHPERSQLTSPKLPVSGAVLAGVPLVARDAYGSRFLVAAPFGYEEDVPDHWYAWDIDDCWANLVVGAGTFGSADEALAEWRGVVGTAGNSELLPGDPALLGRLLGPCLETRLLADAFEGNEPRELLSEFHRMRRRADVLAGATSAVADDTGADGDLAHTEAPKLFRGWYRARHPAAPKGIVGTAGIIVDEWGALRAPDKRSFYACAPFRVTVAAHLIRDNFESAHARRAIRLLPEWTQWCIEQSGIPESLAEPSLAAARKAVEELDEDIVNLPDPTGTTTFRHREASI